MKLLWLMLTLCSVAHAKTYTFYCDTHVGSVSTMDVMPKTEAAMLAENAYDGGDSYEIKNAEASKCNSIKSAWATHKTIFKNRFVTGNHSLEKDPYTLLIDGKILLVHGDRVLWNRKKSDDFRNDKACQGSGIPQKLWFARHGSISKSEAKQLANYAKQFKGNVSVSCHVHVKTKYDKVVDGVRVINLSRGRNEVNIP